MKFVKFSVFALTLGFFAASCNNDTATTEEVKTDTTVTTTPVAEPVAPAPVDTMTAAPAMDTTHAATTTTTTTTEAPKK